MGSGPTSDASREDVRQFFADMDEPSTPVAAADVADRLGCDPDAARDGLDALAAAGDLRAREVGGETRVWWQPGPDRAAARDGQSAEGNRDGQSAEGNRDGQSAEGNRDGQSAEEGVDVGQYDEAQFAAFVSAVRDYAIFMLDPSGTVVSWNEGAERIKGYEAEEIVGQHFSSFYTAADREADVPAENLAKAREAGRVEDEGWRVRADGSQFWANVTITAVRDDDGTLLGFTKVTRDMTERREFEQRLRREYEQTRKLLETAPIAIAVQDTDGETLMANERAQSVFGLTEQEIIDEPEDADEWAVCDADGEPVPPDETPAARAIASGEPVFDEELVIERPADDRLHVRVSAAPLLDDDGTVERVVVAGEDVTELKERERQLERRKSELETELGEIFERISDAFYALDDEFRFTHCNDTAAAILGRTREELLERVVWDAFPDADGVYEERFREAMATQEPVTFEVYEEPIDAWLEFNAYPSETGLSIYFRDVTQRKARERELERYETLFTESTDVNAVLNPDGTFQYLPPSVENVLGYTQDELVGENAFERIHPADGERVRADFERMTDDPDYRPTNEFRYRHADGSWVWLEARGRNLLDDPDIEGLVAYTRDVTDRIERERELRRTERRFEAIFEDPNILVGLLEPDGTVLDINETAMEYVDADLDAVRGEPFWETPWWGAGDGVREDVKEWTERAAAGEYVDFQADLTRPDGERYTLEGFFRPVTDDDGEVVSIVVSDRDVTERRRRERELEESRRRYRALAENFPDGIVTLFDRDLEYELAAGRGFDALSVDPEDLEGRSVRAVWDDGTVGTLEPAFEAAIDGESRSVELEYEGREWLFQAVPITDERGDVFAGMTIAQDITERKERERELAKYETIVETIDDGIYVKDEDGYFTTVNQAYAEMTGYDREDLVGAHASLVVDEDTIDESRAALSSGTDEGDSAPAVEAELETADGDRVPAEGTFATLETDDARQEVGVVRDITERKERERALRERERRLQRYKEYTDDVLDAIDDIFYLLDESGELQRWNETLATVTGYDDAEVASMHALEFFGEDGRETISTAIAEGFETGDVQVEAEVRTADGERIPYEFVASTLEDPDGNPVLAGIGRDITDRREYERKLEASNERLEQFAYAASHDLQEPLRMVSSYLQLIEGRYADDLDADGREFIDFAVDGAERMREMIEGLLAYSRVETQGDPFEPVALDDVLDDVRDDLQLQIEEHDADLTVESLPRVEGDPGQLRQVFQNLIDNAIEYSGDEPPKVHVGVERRRSRSGPTGSGAAPEDVGDEWVLSVRDEGIGIDPSDADRIFEVFQRLHGRDDHAGTGIGLALCRRIVERHGGEIWVESEPGEGSTFFFTLPPAGETNE